MKTSHAVAGIAVVCGLLFLEFYALFAITDTKIDDKGRLCFNIPGDPPVRNCIEKVAG